MSQLLHVLIANALGAGLLAAGAWTVSRRLRRRSLVHALWLLALVKLVSPPILPLPLLPTGTLPDLARRDGPAIVIIDARTSEATEATTPYGPAGASSMALQALQAAASPAHQRSDAEPGRAAPGVDTAPASEAWFANSHSRAEPGGRWGLDDAAALVWTALLAGALVVTALAGLRVRRFRRLLRLAFPAPDALTNRAAELARRVGLRQPPPVLVLPARVPPMLWPGRDGPRLLMPEGLLPELSDEERDTLLVHELAHVRRRDHWVRVLELAVTIVFWWYPVAWWVRRALRREEERCCDEWVLRVMPGSASAYADGLLKSLDLVAAEPDPLPIGASGAGPVRDLESRLKEILMTTPPAPNLANPTRLILAAAAVLGLAVFPTQAQSPQRGEEPPPAPPVERPTPPVEPAVPAAPAPDAAPSPVTAAPAAPAVPSPPLTSPAAPSKPAQPAVLPLPAPAPPAPPSPSADAAPEVVAAPMPEPRPVVIPVPTPHPAPPPQPSPAPIVMPVATPPGSPAGRQDSPEDEAARREMEEQHRKLAEQRARLHQRQLDLTRKRMQQEAEAQQAKARAEAERLRTAGDAERAELVERHARLTAQRMSVQRRELELQQARLREQREREAALQSAAERLRDAEREKQQEKAAALRARLAELEREQARRSLAQEEREIALQREAVEIEHQVRELEVQFERQAALDEHATDVDRLLHATSDLERQIEGQLEALRRLGVENPEHGATAQAEIERLEAALAALRQ